MKYIVFVVLGFILFYSCNKEEQFKPIPEYLSILGEWKSIEGDNYTIVSIKKNGVIKIVRNDQRNKTIKSNKMFYKYDILYCEDKSEGFGASIGIYINPTIDTIRLDIGNATYNNPNSSNTINFTRK